MRIGVERLARLLYQVEELAAAKAGAAQQLAQLESALASSDRYRARWGASDPEAVQAWDQHQSQLRALQATGSATRCYAELSGVLYARPA